MGSFEWQERDILSVISHSTPSLKITSKRDLLKFSNSTPLPPFQVHPKMLLEGKKLLLYIYIYMRGVIYYESERSKSGSYNHTWMVKI